MLQSAKFKTRDSKLSINTRSLTYIEKGDLFEEAASAKGKIK